MKSDLLAICVPTYNRAGYLEIALSRLISQAQKHEIPIYVSDNASTDTTPQVIKKYQAQYPLLFYSRNERNVGPDHNFAIVLKMSPTRYAWLVSDDDHLADQALDQVLAVVAAGDYDLVVVNGGKKLRQSGQLVGRVSDRPVPEVYHDRNKLLSDLGWHMTWMSCLIFSRRAIAQARFEKFYQTSFLQFLAVYDYLADRPLAVYWLPPTLVFNTSVQIPLWYPQALETFGRKWRASVLSLPGSYDLAAKKKCIKDHGVKSCLFGLKSLLRLRVLNYFNFRLYRQNADLLPEITDVNRLVLILVALIPVPEFVSRLIRKIAPIIKERYA